MGSHLRLSPALRVSGRSAPDSLPWWQREPLVLEGNQPRSVGALPLRVSCGQLGDSHAAKPHFPQLWNQHPAPEGVRPGFWNKTKV